MAKSEGCSAELVSQRGVHIVVIGGIDAEFEVVLDEVALAEQGRQQLLIDEVLDLRNHHSTSLLHHMTRVSETLMPSSSISDLKYDFVSAFLPELVQSPLRGVFDASGDSVVLEQHHVVQRQQRGLRGRSIITADEVIPALIPQGE